MYMSRVFLGEPYLRNAVVHELEADGFGEPLIWADKAMWHSRYGKVLTLVVGDDTYS